MTRQFGSEGGVEGLGIGERKFSLGDAGLVGDDAHAHPGSVAAGEQSIEGAGKQNEVRHAMCVAGVVGRESVVAIEHDAPHG